VEAEIAFLDAVAAGNPVVESATYEDRTRAAEIVAQYRDAEVGYVDAVLVAIAERLEDRIIATVDRRHFSLIRPKHVTAFQLVP
jgi:predicted nucleic acid-binding protein